MRLIVRGFEVALLAVLLVAGLTGCAVDIPVPGSALVGVDDGRVAGGFAVPVGPPMMQNAALLTWGEPEVVVTERAPEHAYTLDSGDRLRIFVYGQPNLSRLYTVDPGGMITVPLVGSVKARGRTTVAMERAIRDGLGTQYVKDPQVTVDIQQTRPFFILGEVKAAGQFPYVPGMSVEAAVAIGGGYTDRASHREFRLTRREGNETVRFDVGSAYQIEPGDTVFVYERLF